MGCSSALYSSGGCDNAPNCPAFSIPIAGEMFRLHSEQPCDYAGVFDAPLGTTLRMLVGMLMVYRDPIPEPAGSGFGFCCISLIA